MVCLLCVFGDCAPWFFLFDLSVKRSANRRAGREHAGPLAVRVAWRGRSVGYDPKAIGRMVEKKTEGLAARR